MNDRTPRDQHRGEQPMSLLHAPRSYGSFSDADLVRFRLLLNGRGWTIGMIWATTPTSSSPAKAGITWNTTSKLRNAIWTYLSQCAHEGVDASAAYEAVVADTRGASWSQEFAGFGLVDQARVWLQGFSDDESWARGAALPPRTIHCSWADPAEFRFYVATHLRTNERVLLADGPRLLMRDEGSWWVVPPGDTSISGSSLFEVRAGLHELVDKYGNELLEQAAIVSAFAVSSNSAARTAMPDEAGSEDERNGLIPNNGSWLLIDKTSGWTLDAGSSWLVRALVGVKADLILAEESASERMAYACRTGVPLSFPEAAGTPLDELEGDFWLIDGDNGDFIGNVEDVVLVRASSSGEFDNTEDGCDAAIRYVRDLRTATAMPVVAR